jgi:hypothetical protein
MIAVRAADETITLWKSLCSPSNPPPEAQRDPDGLRLHHAMWMLEQILEHQRNDETWNEYKRQRWLSFAHGLLVCYRVLTLEQVKQINKNA